MKERKKERQGKGGAGRNRKRYEKGRLKWVSLGVQASRAGRRKPVMAKLVQGSTDGRVITRADERG